MKYKKISKILVVFCLLLFQTTLIEAQTINDFPILKGEYLGQKPPGIIPEVFAPGIVSDSTWAEHCRMAVSPEGDEIFWSAYTRLYPKKGGLSSTQQIFFSKRKNGIWSKPEIAEFSKANRYGSNGGPVFSLDGSKLFFYQSYAPVVSNKTTYYVEKINGKWSNTPIKVGELYNNYEPNWTPIFTKKGNAFKYSQDDRVIVKYKYENAIFSNPDTLIIDKAFRQASSIYVSPDEEYLIFSASNSMSYGGTDLYICFKSLDDTWGYPINMGSEINSELVERFPMVSPDGKYLFFMRHTPGQDFYWVSTDIIKELRKIHLAKTNVEKSMVFVQGGRFSMGTNIENHSDHDVTLSDFYISKYEITQKEYESVMGKHRSYFKGGNNPVERVDWYNAVKFCNELSVSQGLTPCYSGSGSVMTCDFTANGYRLPTEAEWEYAAKGGIHHTDNYKYSGTSDNLEEYAWYSVNSDRKSHPVGEKSANQLGLYDMSGNVWEWCWDLYDSDYYDSSPADNPKGSDKGQDRVVRGGGSFDYSDECRNDFRYPKHPNRGLYCLGFRVVRSL